MLHLSSSWPKCLAKTLIIDSTAKQCLIKFWFERFSFNIFNASSRDIYFILPKNRSIGDPLLSIDLRNQSVSDFNQKEKGVVSATLVETTPGGLFYKADLASSIIACNLGDILGIRSKAL